MSNVIVTNPFDQAFRKEILNSSNFEISKLKPQNFSINIQNAESEPNSVESIKLTASNFVSDQEELLETSDFNYITRHNSVNDSGNHLTHSLKSDIQNALIKKIKCQTKEVGSKCSTHRHQSHTNIKLPYPLGYGRYHNDSSNNNNNNAYYYSPSDSDSKQKNRDAAKKSRQRKKLYIAKLENQIKQFKKNEKNLQSKLRDAEKTIEYLNNVMVQLQKSESDSHPTTDFDK